MTDHTSMLPDALPSRRIVRSEWRWVVGWMAAILFLTTIPYLLGWMVSIQTGQTFGGFVIGVVDGNSYLAKMAEGARGAWLFKSAYTSEPHDGALLFFLYILLGKVAALIPGAAVGLPLRMIWVYHVARLAFSALLLCTIYRFLSYILDSISERRLAWLIVAGGGGLGWMLVVTGQTDWLGSMPLDFILPEGFTFLAIFALPHIALARALLLEGLLLWLRISDTGRRRPVIPGLLWFAMALIVPFYPLVIALVLAGTLALRALSERNRDMHHDLRQLVAQTAWAGVLPGAVVVYTAWIFLTNPVMKGWSEQNLVLSPNPLHYLVAYGLSGLFAVLAAVWIVRQIRSGTSSHAQHLLLAWAVVIPLFLYAPFNLQRRMIESYQVPLSALAAIGIARLVWPRLRSHLRRPQLAAGLLGALYVTTPVLLVAGAITTVATPAEPVFHPTGEMTLAEWLVGNASDESIVLCDQSTGNFLPAWAPVRAYLGHGSETVNLVLKQAAVERFFGTASDTWHQELLETNGVDFVVYGPRERLLGSFDPTKAGYLARVFSSGDWDLYEVAW
jgi:hypothetical protein